MAIDPIPSKFLGMINERNIKKSTYPYLSTVIFGGRKKKGPPLMGPLLPSYYSHGSESLGLSVWEAQIGNGRPLNLL